MLELLGGGGGRIKNGIREKQDTVGQLKPRKGW